MRRFHSWNRNRRESQVLQRVKIQGKAGKGRICSGNEVITDKSGKLLLY
jgi:hypothetical protein